MGWSVDDSGIFSINDSDRGVTEWEGWSFADKFWWSTAAGDEDRSAFNLGVGTVAVADPDEWDDRGNPATGLPFLGYYNALMTTPAIPLASSADSARLTFSSSWRDECCDDGPSDTNDQTAVVRASFDGGQNFSELMRWESDPASPFHKSEATNETVLLELNAPQGANDVVLEFGLLNAGNDRWWAIDNVELFAPSLVSVDTANGRMSISGATGITGYEIKSPQGSLDGESGQLGNLDAQNVGSVDPLTADFDLDNAVTAADFSIWRNGLAAGDLADANGDLSTDAEDYQLWREQFGGSVGDGEAWETLIASDTHLLEFFLTGNSTLEDASLGVGFDVAKNIHDLQFIYSTDGGSEFEGEVVYFSSAAAFHQDKVVSLPEPASLISLIGLAMTAVGMRRGIPWRT